VSGVRKLKTALIAIVGLIAFIVVVSLVVPPHEQEMAVSNEQAQEAAQARIRATLQAELDGGRPAVIQEIKDLTSKQEYLRAYQRANRFRQFEDPELSQLASTALALHEEQEAKRLASALRAMVKDTDKVEGIDWYRDKSSPQYNNQNGFFLYIGKKAAGNPFLRLRVQYYADDWLFIESFIVVADGQRFDRVGTKFERDNASGDIWEWYDEAALAADVEMIRAVIASKDALIRFMGSQYHRDKPITAAQKAALGNVLSAYEALGGKP
jgi:hypothetical protein